MVIIPPQAKAEEAFGWHEVNLPGRGGYALAPGYDITTLATSPQGTVYASVSGGLGLLRSSDGRNWSRVGNSPEEVISFAFTPKAIYLLTPNSVFRSGDGLSFYPLAPLPDRVKATSLDILSQQDGDILLVSAKGDGEVETGGVYLLNSGELFSTWQDTHLEGFNVYSARFSAEFSSDQRLLAVASDGAGTYLMVWEGLWRKEALISGVATWGAEIVFAPEILGNGGFLVALDSGEGNGDLYAVNYWSEGCEVIDLNIGSAWGLSGVDITSLVVGERILAGTMEGEVYTGELTPGGLVWEKSLKKPGGEMVKLALDPGGSLAYAATSGKGSGFSLSCDGGRTWNQLSLIDTEITTILDLAISPYYEQDGTAFLLTFGGDQTSLWRSRDGLLSWERVFSGGVAGASSFGCVELSPFYAESGVLFVSGWDGDGPALWRSDDGGESFSCYSSPLEVLCLKVLSDSELFLAGYDSRLFYSDNAGRSFTGTVVDGATQISSIAISPAYEDDHTMLVGANNGVYISRNAGHLFTELPLLPSPSYNISLILDPDFALNQMVYAANGEGLFRLKIGDGAWQKLGDLPTGSIINEVVISSDGVLYALDSSVGDGPGRIWRSLSPDHPSGASFEEFSSGLYGEGPLDGLWPWGDELWVGDSSGGRLYNFRDTLKFPVEPDEPQDGAPGIGIFLPDETVSDITLNWLSLKGASGYEWQLRDESGEIVDGGETTVTSVTIADLKPGVTYSWRVRVISPLASLWSEWCSFTTIIGGEVFSITLESPLPGAQEVPLRPLFQWQAVRGASGYELVVSPNSDFSEPVISLTGEDALLVNAWRSDIALEEEKTYYWKVRAISPDSNSTWSVGIFTTDVSAEPTTVVTITTNAPVDPQPTVTSVVTITANATAEPPGTVTSVATITVDAPQEVTTTVTSVATVTAAPPPMEVHLDPPPWLLYLVAFLGVGLMALAVTLVMVLRRR